MSKPKTIKIDKVEYVRADSVEQVEWTGDETIHSRWIGEKVLVRSRNEGVNAGIVVLADDKCVELRECRRLWYHKPKSKKDSWYEGVAKSGISKDSKVSCTSTKLINEIYSLTKCSDEAYATIMAITPNEQ